MKILHVSYAYSHLAEFGGPAAKVQALAEGLARRGHQVTVLTASKDMRERQEIASGVQVLYLRSWLRYRTLTFTPGVFPFCARHLKNFDIVHIYGLYEMLGAVVGAFCRRMKKPYVLEPTGMNRPVGRSLWKKRTYHALFGRSLFDGASTIIATSSVERDQLIADRIPSDQIVIRRNGINLDEFGSARSKEAFLSKQKIDRSAKVVMFLGRIAPIKNLENLLKAFALVKEQNTRLVLIGPDQNDGHLDLLKKLTKQLGISERVSFSGPVYGSEKAEAFTAADVFVLPSKSESFGIAALEAMACGVPVVVTETCGIAEHVRGKAGLVVGGDVQAIASGIIGLLNNPDEARRYGQQGKRVALEFSWEGPLTETEDLYNRLVHPGMVESTGPTA